jgi:hypothetical protein
MTRAIPNPVHRLLNPLGFVAFKISHLRGGPSRTGVKGASRTSLLLWRSGLTVAAVKLVRDVTDPAVRRPPDSSRLIFKETLRAAAGWLFFLRRGGSTVMIQIAALYRQSGSDRLEKQPTDPTTAGRNPRDLGDGALVRFGHRGPKNQSGGLPSLTKRE